MEVGETGVGEMGQIIGETGVGEMGVGEMGTSLVNMSYRKINMELNTANTLYMYF